MVAMMGMILIALLLTSFVASTPIITATNTCSTGLQAIIIMELCYNATYDLIRRGLADDIATGHMRTAMSELVRWATTTGGKNASLVPLGSVCIPVERYSTIFTVRWSTVYSESELDDMLMSISNAFYHVNGTRDLPDPISSQVQERDTYLEALRKELRVEMAKISYVNVRMPPTVTNAYDAKKQESCEQWEKYTNFSQKTRAVVGARRQLKLCVDLLRLGCDPLGVWQLLRHYTALVHLGIRCERMEGANLMVPDYFRSSYSNAIIRLINQADKASQMKQIEASHDTAFDTLFGFEYARLSTHGSWGQSDSHFGSGMTIKNLMSYTSSATSTQLALTETLMANRYTSSRMYLEVTSRTPDCMDVGKNTRITQTGSKEQCDTSKHYCFYALPYASNWVDNCCNSAVCVNAVKLGTLFTNYADCCAVCNQGVGCTPALTSKDSIEVPNNNEKEPGVVHIYAL